MNTLKINSGIPSRYLGDSRITKHPIFNIHESYAKLGFILKKIPKYTGDPKSFISSNAYLDEIHIVEKTPEWFKFSVDGEYMNSKLFEQYL